MPFGDIGVTFRAKKFCFIFTEPIARGSGILYAFAIIANEKRHIIYTLLAPSCANAVRTRRGRFQALR